MSKKMTEAAEELRRYWPAFADADPIPDPDGFTDRMEAAGLIRLRAVIPRDLEDAFAAERGIEPGGMLWEPTPAGRAVLEHGGEKET